MVYRLLEGGQQDGTGGGGQRRRGQGDRGYGGMSGAADSMSGTVVTASTVGHGMVSWVGASERAHRDARHAGARTGWDLGGLANYRPGGKRARTYSFRSAYRVS